MPNRAALVASHSKGVGKLFSYSSYSNVKLHTKQNHLHFFFLRALTVTEILLGVYLCSIKNMNATPFLLFSGILAWLLLLSSPI